MSCGVREGLNVMWCERGAMSCGVREGLNVMWCERGAECHVV